MASKQSRWSKRREEQKFDKAIQLGYLNKFSLLCYHEYTFFVKFETLSA